MQFEIADQFSNKIQKQQMACSMRFYSPIEIKFGTVESFLTLTRKMEIVSENRSMTKK